VLSLAAAVAMPAAAVAALALAAPAGASTAQPGVPGRVSIAIDSMSPQTARPGRTVTVSGTVSNETGQATAGLDVQLLTSSERFASRDLMDQYASQGTGASLVAAGPSVFLTPGLRPGATAQWHASFQVDAAGITEFGVYPIDAQLVDQNGDLLASAPTLLPFWPGQQAAGLARPLDIAWTWPLIDQPHHQVCTALTNNDLATGLAGPGRLARLLAVGQAHPGAHLTWVIDPALLSDADTMTRAYQVDSGPGCSNPASEPASRAAASWLSGLREVTSDQPTVLTPYANVDVAALVHNGLAADVTTAYGLGDTVAKSLLHGSAATSIAVLPGGTADLSVLTSLAATQHIGTVVLDSSELPANAAAGFEPDDAVTSVRTQNGQHVTVLLADHVLTGVLADGDTSSGTLSPGTQFTVSQRFLAETAMIAAELPGTDRSVVVAPPENWSPSAGLASQLLSETTSAPWLSPVTLGSLAGTRDSDRTIARQSLPASQTSPDELSSRYLSTISAAGTALSVYSDLLAQPSAAYRQALNEALIATESAAWRGGGAAQGLGLARKLTSFMSGEESRIVIVAAQQVPMGGSSGLVPVSVQNGSQHAIQIKLSANVVSAANQASPLTVGHFQNLVTVQPKQEWTFRLPVSSAPIGPTDIRLSLSTKSGLPLPQHPASLTVESTRYGRAILFLIGAAIGVLVLTSVFRGIRRWLHAEGRSAPGNPDSPGSVVTGTSSAQHPTEARDDLAEARRWVDDT
jgi:hypothetical protein